MRSTVKPALIMLLLFTALTGVAYPAAVTGLGQLLFPRQANGSLITRDGRVVGSALIGQSFTDPRYFSSRPSATAAFPYDASSSTGSNLGPLNPALKDAVAERLTQARDADASMKVPVDLVTTSASGLDPHISPAAALYQVARVARARGLAPDQVEEAVKAHTEGRTFRLFGEPRVNVLELNLALDQMSRAASPAERVLSGTPQ